LINSNWSNPHRGYIWNSESKDMVKNYQTLNGGGVNVSKWTYKAKNYQISATKIIGKTLFEKLNTGRYAKKQSDDRFSGK
jgi:pyridoxine 5'-phosphate synthase PdxJ